MGGSRKGKGQKPRNKIKSLDASTRKIYFLKKKQQKTLNFGFVMYCVFFMKKKKLSKRKIK